MCVYSCRMPFQFCPQCGTKLQPAFKFCPSCGERLPCPHDELVPVRMAPSLDFSLPEEDGTCVSKTSLALSPEHEPTRGKSKAFHRFSYFSSVFVFVNLENCRSLCLPGQTWTTSSQVPTRSSVRQARSSLRLTKVAFKPVTSPRVSSPAKEDQTHGN